LVPAAAETGNEQDRIGRAFEVHRAGAALREPAAKMRVVEPDLVTRSSTPAQRGRAIVDMQRVAGQDVGSEGVHKRLLRRRRRPDYGAQLGASASTTRVRR
jgi:hypothetical protein